MMPDWTPEKEQQLLDIVKAVEKLEKRLERLEAKTPPTNLVSQRFVSLLRDHSA